MIIRSNTSNIIKVVINSNSTCSYYHNDEEIEFEIVKQRISQLDNEIVLVINYNNINYVCSNFTIVDNDIKLIFYVYDDILTENTINKIIIITLSNNDCVIDSKDLTINNSNTTDKVISNDNYFAYISNTNILISIEDINYIKNAINDVISYIFEENNYMIRRNIIINIYGNGDDEYVEHCNLRYVDYGGFNHKHIKLYFMFNKPIDYITNTIQSQELIININNTNDIKECTSVSYGNIFTTSINI